jgi:hypothetical protein
MIRFCTKPLGSDCGFLLPALNLFMLDKNVCVREEIMNKLDSGYACCDSFRNLSPRFCYLKI